MHRHLPSLIITASHIAFFLLASSSCLLSDAFQLPSTLLPSKIALRVGVVAPARSPSRLHLVAPEDIADETFDLAVIGAGPVGENDFSLFSLLFIIISCLALLSS